MYIPLSRYYTTPGEWQTISMPFSDFGANVIGGRFDMQHLKDWTMVNMLPLGQPVQFRNMRLVGTCGVSPTTTTTRVVTTTSLQAVSTSAAPPQSSSASSPSNAQTSYLPPAPASRTSASPTAQPTNNLQSGARSFVTGIIAGLLPAIYLAFF